MEVPLSNEHGPGLGPNITQLERKFRELGLKLADSEHEGMVEEAAGLMQECMVLLQKWRRRNNYPVLRVHPDDEKNIDQFQTLFPEAYDCLLHCENKLVETDAAENGKSLRLEEIRKMKQRLIAKSLVMEENPRQIKQVVKGKSDEIRVVIRCLLPFLWPESKSVLEPKISVRDVYTRSTSTESLKVTRIVTENSSGSDTFGRNRIIIRGLFTKPKTTQKREKHLYILSFEFGGEYSAVVETLPIIFYSHTTQIPILSGHIFWFNAFSIADDPCLVNQSFPVSTSVAELLDVLDVEFHHASSVMAKYMKTTVTHNTASEKRFSTSNRHCLTQMLGMENPRDVVTFGEFLNRLVDRKNKFTFYEWFYACFKTRCEYLHDLYEHGLVVGFIDKKEAETCLKEHCKNQKPGSAVFLLRFSMNYIEGGHGYISPSMFPWGPDNEPVHGMLINANLYEKNDKKFGKVFLSQIQGVDSERLFVLTNTGSCEAMLDAFADFMETETFDGYEALAMKQEEGSERSHSVATSPSQSSVSFSPSMSSASLMDERTDESANTPPRGEVYSSVLNDLIPPSSQEEFGNIGDQSHQLIDSLDMDFEQLLSGDNYKSVLEPDEFPPY